MSGNKAGGAPPTKMVRFVNEVVDLGLVGMAALFATLILFQRQGWFQMLSPMWLLLLTVCCVLLWTKYWLRQHEARLFRWYYLGVALFLTVITLALAISTLIQGP